MMARSFEDLEVWRRAHGFVLSVYRLTVGFPKEELFGLTSQLRRAAVSVPANIAEGFAKRGKSDKLRIYNIAQGSLEECRYYLRLSKDLGYGDTVGMARELDEISRMLGSYAQAIAASRNRTIGVALGLAMLFVCSAFYLLTSSF